MSQSTLDLTEKTCTPADRKDPRPASTGEPLTRSPFTDYGDGIVQCAYTPPKGKGESQRLCGVLGKDRLEAVEMVKRGILSLSEVAPERFAFQVFVQSEWVIVLDEIWELLSRDPPLIWVVTIRELPEEREQRLKLEERNSRRWKSQLMTCVVSISVAVFASAVGIADGSMQGHLKSGAMAGAIGLLIMVIIDGYSAK